jgi:hypothetical protein
MLVLETCYRLEIEAHHDQLSGMGRPEGGLYLSVDDPVVFG